MTETVLLQSSNLTYRVRPGTGRKVLLLLHGWTGDENSMTVFSGKFPEDYWLLFPRAPYDLETGGYSWREITKDSGWPALDLFRNSCSLLITFMQEVKNIHQLSFPIFDVCGFSQGGALTISLGTLYPELVRKMAILSGFAPAGCEKELNSQFFNGKHIFMSHGTSDQIVPISMAYHAKNLLENSGAKVLFSESECGHKMSSISLRALSNYLSD